MATVSIYFDRRYKSASGKYPLCYRVNLPGSRSCLIKTGLSIPPEWWDGAEIIRAPRREQMNRMLRTGRTAVEDALLQMQLTVGLQLRPAEIRARLLALRDGKTFSDPDAKTFNRFFEEYIAQKDRTTTQNTYRHTLQKIEQFAARDGHPSAWRFEEITFDWVKRFEHFLKTQHLDDEGNPVAGVRKLRINGIGLHLRNVRAVVNDALNRELMTAYPFRKFKIKKEETAKRALTVEELRLLRDYPCEPHLERYRDLFLLIFYMMGVNTVDLFSLQEIRNGRTEYRRSKTGRLLCIRIEPEAQAILDKYRGTNYLLNVGDTYGNYRDFVHLMNDSLKKIGPVQRKGRGGKKVRNPLFPKLSTYWARHTWATLAAELDIPDQTISMALGHAAGTVTDIYIKRNREKVDAANRKVIDYLFGRQSE